MKITKQDSVFSKYIRKRDKNTCQRCGRKFPERAMGLHCSHYMGRTNKSTRYNEDNCDALCHGCHSYFEDRKQTAYRDWKILQLGIERVEDVEMASREICKRSPAELQAIYDYYKELI